MSIRFLAPLLIFSLYSLGYGMHTNFDYTDHLENLSTAAHMSVISLPANIYNSGNIRATELNCEALLKLVCHARETKLAGYHLARIFAIKNCWKLIHNTYDRQFEDMIKLHKTMLKTCGKQKVKISYDEALQPEHHRINAQTTELLSSLQSLRNIKDEVSAIHINFLALMVESQPANNSALKNIH